MQLRGRDGDGSVDLDLDAKKGDRFDSPAVRGDGGRSIVAIDPNRCLTVRFHWCTAWTKCPSVGPGSVGFNGNTGAHLEMGYNGPGTVKVNCTIGDRKRGPKCNVETQ